MVVRDCIGRLYHYNHRFMTDFLEGDVIEIHFWAQAKSGWLMRSLLYGD